MKRRPKLNLSSNDRADKEPPPGFDDVEANDGAPERKTKETGGPASPKQEEPSSGNSPDRTESPGKGSGTSATFAGIDRKKLVKVLVVAAVCVGTIYLLKRRFFV